VVEWGIPESGGNTEGVILEELLAICGSREISPRFPGRGAEIKERRVNQVQGIHRILLGVLLWERRG
jgi:hypothetical protein